MNRTASPPPRTQGAGLAPSAPSAHAAAPAAATPVPGGTAPPPKGRLEWPVLLEWLRLDGWISADDAARVAARFRAGSSSLHALVRLGGAGLLKQGSGKSLDTEALTEWIAGRCRLPYLRIDPLRVAVGRVAAVMSVQYAAMRRALPVSVGPPEVVIATAEP
ncbi:MAG: hypothetical protein KGJ30_10260, partial [Burkholderiales bacterium]|nr:hypothetical protein [Burkholderiales bacterium]